MPVVIEADPLGMVDQHELYYRAAKTGAYSTVRGKRGAALTLPPAFVGGLLPGARVEFFVRTLDGNGAVLAENGTDQVPYVFAVRSDLDTGPPPVSLVHQVVGVDRGRGRRGRGRRDRRVLRHPLQRHQDADHHGEAEMTRARLAGVVLVALGALGAFAAGCQDDEGPATGLDVGVDISEPYSKLGSLKVTARTASGFMPMPPTQTAPGVTAQVENDVLAVTFAARYTFTTTVQFLLAIETAAPLDVILQAEVKDETGGTIALSVEVTRTVTPGLRTPALLQAPCLVAGACESRDGGLPAPSADQAAQFWLLGGQLGSQLQNAVVTQVTQVAVCHFGGATAPADLVVGVPQAQDYFGNVNRGRVLVYRGQGRSWSGRSRSTRRT